MFPLVRVLGVIQHEIKNRTASYGGVAANVAAASELSKVVRRLVS